MNRLHLLAVISLLIADAATAQTAAGVAAVASAAPAASSAPSTSNTFQPPGPYLKRHVTYTVARDGTYVKEHESLARADNEAGVREWGQGSTHYSASLQKVEVLAAYVITPEGKRIDVPASSIYTQEPHASQGAPMFSDYKVNTIVYPQVVPGTTVARTMRLTQLKPVFPGHFSAVETMSPHHVWEDTRYTVIAPSDMPMEVRGEGAEVEKSVMDDGRIRWTMKATRQNAIPRERGSVGMLDYSVRFTASTFLTPAALAEAYRAIVGDRMRPTPKAVALAERLTQGMNGDRAEAKALYDWVRLNVRYVGVFLGVGGWVPREVDAVIDSAYGDCKDHTTLLAALLAAKGIRSSPVLIHAGNTFWTPQPTAMQGYNHMILYVPSLDMYLDPTATHAAFGVLPDSDAGKTVLHTADGRVGETPIMKAEQEATVITSRLRYAADGRLAAKVDLSMSGNAGLGMRNVFSSLTQIPDAQLVPRLLAASELKGEGRLQRPDPKSVEAETRIGLEATSPNAAEFPGPGSFMPPLLLNRGVGMGVAMWPEPGRLPVACQAFSFKEDTAIELPAGVTVSRGVSDAEESAANASFTARFTAVSQPSPTGLQYTRTLVFQPTGRSCAPEDMPALHDLGSRIQRHLRTQIVY